MSLRKKQDTTEEGEKTSQAQAFQNATEKNVLWTHEAKVELFRKNTQHYAWCEKDTLYQHENIIRQSSMMEEA